MVSAARGSPAPRSASGLVTLTTRMSSPLRVVALQHAAGEGPGAVAGVQFHPEVTRDGVAHLVRTCDHELQARTRWVQSAREIEAGLRHLPAMHAALDDMLDRLAAVTRTGTHTR